LFESLKEKNGNVQVSKLSTYLKAQGMDNEWVAKAMQQIDVNGDNELTWAEFATKGIRIVHHLKLHADHVAKTGGKKAAPAAHAGTAAPNTGNARAVQKATTTAHAAAPAAGAHAASQDLAPVANARTRNEKLVWRERTRAETDALIKAEAAHKAAPAANANVKRRKHFVPNKPTKDEKGVLNRLRKHDSTKAPAFEKTLNDKYSKKKKAVPEKKK